MSSSRRAASLCAVAWSTTLFTPLAVNGQWLDIGDPFEAYYRLLQISGRSDAGSFTVRPLRSRPEATGATVHPWAAHLDAPAGDDGGPRWKLGDSRLRLFVNTHHPEVQNDGAVWQGRGVTTVLESNSSLEWGPLTVRLNPVLMYNHNDWFELAPVGEPDLPPYAYPWRRIDLPQRFGPDPFWTFDSGQSEVSLRWRGARLSAGTANMWWGPGLRNAIVMSNNAPGFFHVSLGTTGPVDVGIGELEGEWIWGRLGQSDWFDPTVAETGRHITGVVLAYSPSFAANLTIGGTRVFQTEVPAGGVPFGDHFLIFQGFLKEGLPNGGNDRADQLLSLFMRWRLPESGLELYLEWARNDHSGNFEDLFLEPEHSRGYTAGLQKVLALSSERLIALKAELTHLEASPTFQLRPRPIYYEHRLVTQGYTHEGQILGAGIGPGGNAQALGVDFYSPRGAMALFVQRRIHDNDAFWVVGQANGYSFVQHHASLDLGASTTYLAGDLEFEGNVMLTREFNRYFGTAESWNLNLGLSARWRPNSAAGG